MIYVVPGVPLIAQDKKNACWYMSAKMLVSWRKKKGAAPIGLKDPAEETQLKNLYTGDCGLAPSTCEWFGKQIGLTAHKGKDASQSGLEPLIKKYGPLWFAGLKKVGGEKYAHVRVIAGVADTGVLVYDPEPMKSGSSEWRTWTWLTDALNESEFDVNYLYCSS
jgi:hypothetical protein